MGTFSVLRPGIGAGQLQAAAQLLTTGTGIDIASPWAPPSHLASIVWADIFGAGVAAPLTRAEAMRVPAVSRSRHIITTTTARIPLRAYRGETDERLADQPSWIVSTSGPMSPLHRMLWTADDLFFYGWSCWARTNDAAGRLPLQMERIPMGEWRIESGRLERWYGELIGWQTLKAAEAVLIPGMHEGLLTFAAESIRHAADLQRAAGRAAKTPAAHLALRQTGGTPLTRDQIKQLVADWAEARNGENGGVAYLNQSIEAIELGAFDKHLVIEGRNAAAVDIARHASIPADLIDASQNDASLTYQNSRDNDRRAIDYGIGGYMSAISARLSQDDVTPRGTRVAFDLEQWLAGTAPGQPVPSSPAPAPTSPQVPAPVPATTGETTQ